MRRFILILAILIFSVWAGLKIAADPGIAFFSYDHWSVEMPLWFAIVIFVLVLLASYFILRIFDGIDAWRRRWRNWLEWRRKNKSHSKTTRGFLDLIAGEWKSAEQALLSGLEQSDAPYINYLAAAKAAHEQEAYDRCEAYLRKARDYAPEEELAIGIAQAQLELTAGRLEPALATLNRVRAFAPKQKVVLKLLERVYIHLGEWRKLLKLLPMLYKVGLVDAKNLELLELKVHEELLKAAAHNKESVEILRQLWQAVPSKLRLHLGLVNCYVQLMMTYPGTAVELDEIINKTVRKSWDSSLVRLYGLLMVPEAKRALANAEDWFRSYSNEPALLLTLGRLCMRCQLWGKARSYLEGSLDLKPTPETYIEYGKLLEQLGDLNSAARQYRDGLLLAVEKY